MAHDDLAGLEQGELLGGPGLSVVLGVQARDLLAGGKEAVAPVPVGAQVAERAQAVDVARPTGRVTEQAAAFVHGAFPTNG